MTRFSKLRFLGLISTLPLVGFLVLAFLLFQRIFAGDPQTLPSALIGKPAPEFSLPPLAGANVPGLSTKDLQSGKLTLVNIWASWCVPCRVEHPELMRLAYFSLDKRANPFRIVGINYKDGTEAAQKFLKENGNPFAAIGADENGRVGIDWGVYGVPESYIVDGAGKILFKHVGPLTAEIIRDDILPRLSKK